MSRCASHVTPTRTHTNTHTHTHTTADRGLSESEEHDACQALVSLMHHAPLDGSSKPVHRSSPPGTSNKPTDETPCPGPSWGESGTPANRVACHMGACSVCVFAWCLVAALVYAGSRWATPWMLRVGRATVHILNGEQGVTCKTVDLPLNHIQCMFQLSLTNWVHTVLTNLSQYLANLKGPGDMFCFLCTALGGVYFTCFRLFARVCSAMTGAAAHLTRRLYRTAFHCLDNPMVPFGYIEETMGRCR